MTTEYERVFCPNCTENQRKVVLYKNRVFDTYKCAFCGKCYSAEEVTKKAANNG